MNLEAAANEKASDADASELLNVGEK